jgi:hypothetical protein
MKRFITNLTGVALDYAVAICENRTIKKDPMGLGDGRYWIWEEVPSKQGGIILERSIYLDIGRKYSPSTIWAQGGPIIQREGISLICYEAEDSWGARRLKNPIDLSEHYYRGKTPLEAAMLSYVGMKLGNNLRIPPELLVKNN